MDAGIMPRVADRAEAIELKPDLRPDEAFGPSEAGLRNRKPIG